MSTFVYDNANVSYSVTCYNMQSVTSNAVANAINVSAIVNYLQSMKIDYKTGKMPSSTGSEKRINLLPRGTNEHYILLGCRVIRPNTNYIYDISTVGACLFENNQAILYVNSEFAQYVGNADVGVLYAIGKFTS